MKLLEESKGNVSAYKYMKVETAKEGSRLLLLEGVGFQPKIREDTPSSKCFKCHMKPHVDHLGASNLWALWMSLSTRLVDDLSVNPLCYWQRGLEKMKYYV